MVGNKLAQQTGVFHGPKGSLTVRVNGCFKPDLAYLCATVGRTPADKWQKSIFVYVNAVGGRGLSYGYCEMKVCKCLEFCILTFS